MDSSRLPGIINASGRLAITDFRKGKQRKRQKASASAPLPALLQSQIRNRQSVIAVGPRKLTIDD